MLDLRLVTRERDLRHRGAHLGHQAAQLDRLVAHVSLDGVPRRAELVAALLDVGAPGVGEVEHLARVALLDPDQPLVLYAISGPFKKHR